MLLSELNGAENHGWERNPCLILVNKFLNYHIGVSIQR